jgi:hypothetical protein
MRAFRHADADVRAAFVRAVHFLECAVATQPTGVLKSKELRDFLFFLGRALEAERAKKGEGVWKWLERAEAEGVKLAALCERISSAR